MTNFNDSVTVFSRTASGNVAPLRTISGPVTFLSGPVGIDLDGVNNELFVVNLSSVVPVPTLSEWALIVMAAVLVLGGLMALRRRPALI